MVISQCNIINWTNTPTNNFLMAIKIHMPSQPRNAVQEGQYKMYIQNIFWTPPPPNHTHTDTHIMQTIRDSHLESADIRRPGDSI